MIQPVNGMLLIKEEEKAEKKTASGLVLSASITDLGPKRGTVIQVGNGETNHFTGGTIPMDFKINDIVVYPDHSGVDIEDSDGEKYIIIHNKHIMAKVV